MDLDKLGGDKKGGAFKMNFQIRDVADPKSMNNACLRLVTNLHIALERYKEQVNTYKG